MVISSSSTTMAVREVTGSHVVTIDGYALSKGVKSGDCFSSSFMAAGHSWVLRYYPRGSNDFDFGWMSMYLKLAHGSARARFTISLLDCKGQPVPSCTHTKTRVRNLCSDWYSESGFGKFIRRKKLEKSGHLREDCFRVRCDITVLKQTSTEDIKKGATTDVATTVATAVAAAVRSAVVPSLPPPPPKIPVSKKEMTKEEDNGATAIAAAVRSAVMASLPPPPDIPVSTKEMTKEEEDDALERFVVVPPPDMDRHLGHLLSSGEGADVTLEVDGEMFIAHRTILAARSPVFKGELFGPMEEGTSPTCVRIKDMEVGVFEVLLHFIYTDSLPPDVLDEGDEMTIAMAQHLLVAADRYSMERLKLICEDKLCRYIATSSVGTILALAEQHGCEGLKKACLKFLMSGNNLKAAIATDGFDHLANSCPLVLKELLSKVAL